MSTIKTQKPTNLKKKNKKKIKENIQIIRAGDMQRDTRMAEPK